jgi:hypothetical protein
MKRCQFQRSPAEASATRTPWLRRMRNAPVFGPRSAHRKEDAAIDTVPAIEDQRRAPWPICSAQRVSTGIACGAPAVAVAETHAIDGCEQMGLSPDGDVVETLCHGCLFTVQRGMAAYVGDKREMAFRRGSQPVSSTCGRPTLYLRNVFAVLPVGPK